MAKNLNSQTSLFSSDDLSFNFPEFQTHTHPVAFGWDSILSDLERGKAKAADAIMHVVVNYLSNWKSGESHCLSVSRLSEFLSISESYVSKILNRMARWLKRLKTTRKGSIFEVVRHDFDPQVPASDRESDTFAVPYGLGSPIERMFRGHISWKACLVWIILKLHSDWTTGETDPTNMIEIASRCRLGLQTVCECIKELESAGLLKRLSAKNEAAVYQLLPKPKPKKKQKKQDDSWHDGTLGHSAGTHFVSQNWQYRISYAEGHIEKRVGYHEWERVSDYEIAQVIPKVIVHDLNLAFTLRSSLTEHLACT